MSSEGTNQVWGYHKFGGSINDYALETLPKPAIDTSRPYDVLVRNYAAGLNPTDENKRSGLYGHTGVSAEVVIGGYDGSGVIEAVGPQVKNFRVGDQVWYAGDASRHGNFAQYTLVDSRIISLKPKTLSHEEAVALPLTAITVWEGVKERLNPVPGKDILIVAGAGGVGSIAIQLCKLWGLRVTATASRPETSEWCVKLGADFIIDHTKKYAQELQRCSSSGKGSIKGFDYVLLASNDSHLAEVVSVLNPRGHIVSILPFYRDNKNEIGQVFLKSASLHFEYMFSRPSFGYEEQKQGDLLAEVAKLVDAGTIKSTLNQTFEWADFLKAQQLLVSGKTIGKTALKIS